MGKRTTNIRDRRVARMEKIDGFSPDIRALIHEYGFHVVDTLLHVGVRDPKQIKHVIETVLNELSSTRGTRSRQGGR